MHAIMVRSSSNARLNIEVIADDQETRLHEIVKTDPAASCSDIHREDDGRGRCHGAAPDGPGGRCAGLTCSVPTSAMTYASARSARRRCFTPRLRTSTPVPTRTAGTRPGRLTSWSSTCSAGTHTGDTPEEG